MDIILLFTIASASIVLIFILALLKQRGSEGETVQQRGIPQQREGQVPRRAVGARNVRGRLRAAATRHHEDDDADEEEDRPEAADEIEFPEGKIGAKKRAKLEAKAERKAQREAEERSREDKKKRQEQLEEERQRTAQKEKEEEERRLEEEKKAKEEKERQEYEEYLKMKAAFSVEEEGFEEGEQEGEENNLLQEFINYIKNMKVVVLEDLASHFKLKTQNVIDRIQQLQDEGILTGVIDDRGKFIYISQEELEAVAKFVKQRGRVSITELAESSNQLINLNPNIKTTVSA